MSYSDRSCWQGSSNAKPVAKERMMKAVATVVMNRVRFYGEYHRVCQAIFVSDLSKGQFDCVRSVIRGQPNPQTIWANPPEQIHYDIADWAMAGNRLSPIGDCLWYFNPFQPTCPSTFPRNGTGSFQARINQHCFYSPTELYAQT